VRRYTLLLLLVAALVLVATYALSYYFEPIESDLTRIGAYSERNYGWNQIQPAVHIEPNGKELTEPDLVVLGDSFSIGNVWQSVLSQRTHLKTQSHLHAENNCTSAWVKQVVDQTSVKVVVIETVERVFLDRFTKSLDCESVSAIPFDVHPTESGTTRALGPVDFHIKHSLKTLLNELRVEFKPSQAIEDNVINVPIDPRCAAFSNRRSDRMLYLSDDDEKLNWSSQSVLAAVENVQKLKALVVAKGKQFIFIVVPDKSSVYRHCMRDQRAAQRMTAVDVAKLLRTASVLAPDLTGAFRAIASSQVDLYAPNNTHFSTLGYINLAGLIEDALRQNGTSLSN